MEIENQEVKLSSIGFALAGVVGVLAFIAVTGGAIYSILGGTSAEYKTVTISSSLAHPESGICQVTFTDNETKSIGFGTAPLGSNCSSWLPGTQKNYNGVSFSD